MDENERSRLSLCDVLRASTDTHPDTICSRHERTALVLRLLRELPERHWRLLMLRYVDGLTWREIAIRLNVVESAALQAHARIVATLAEKMTSLRIEARHL